MIINRTFENTASQDIMKNILEDLFDSLISAYYSEIKVISATSSEKEDV